MPTHLNIQALDTTTEGSGPVVLMPHGWPDSPALRDETVAALKDACRSRFRVRRIGCRTAPERIGWPMNDPCAMQGFGAHGGLRRLQRFDLVRGPVISTLFIVGWRKPFTFHAPRWLASLGTTPGCAVLGSDAGRWLMKQHHAAFNRAVQPWLDQPA